MSEMNGVKPNDNQAADDNVVDATAFEEKLAEKEQEAVEAAEEQPIDPENPLGIDEDMPLTDENIQSMATLLKQLRRNVDIMQDVWMQTKKDFSLTNEHMYKLHQYNEQHKVPAPVQEDGETPDDYDEFNGLDEIPEEEIENIFGEGHPIFGVHIDQTRDRVKTAASDFFNCLNFTKEYNETERMYHVLLEMKEAQEIEKLKMIAEAQEDPEKKAPLLKSIDDYYRDKFLGYLKDPIGDFEKKKLIDAFGDAKTIDYWLRRTRDKLTQINMNQQFILEISQFEDRFLPERYHKLSNMTLLYFMQKIIYSNISDPKAHDRSIIHAFIMAMDGVIRKTFSADNVQLVLDNIMALLEQLIDDVYAKYYPTEVPPSLVNKHYPYNEKPPVGEGSNVEVPPIAATEPVKSESPNARKGYFTANNKTEEGDTE